jgi:predicted nucleic acid-binding protein
MKFWDSSAVIPLLVTESMSASIQRLFEDDPVIVACWATEIECTSAIARRQRTGHIREEVVAEGFNRLNALREGWHEVEPGEEIRESAKRLLRVHDLRTADALQLAAAFYVAEARRRLWNLCAWTNVSSMLPAARVSPSRSSPGEIRRNCSLSLISHSRYPSNAEERHE